MGEKYTEAQKKASIKYMQDKTDDIRLRLPKGTKDRWKAAAEAVGVSMTKFVQDAVEVTIPQWISVEERLPADETEVLCWYRNEDGEYYCTLGWYHRTNYVKGWTTDAEISGDYGRVTHWMPLPEPPHKK